MRFVKGLYIHPARIMTARILLLEDELLTGESLVFAQNKVHRNGKYQFFTLEES
ncbi:MAG: hypothetical protein QGH68_06695 [SAR324 cluster bacterium]|nr:hypothetical protein [SAR324 cluster bacterium]